jgi:hypothetical protein
MTTILDRLARIVLSGTQAELEAWARDYQATQDRRKAKAAPRVQRVKATKEQAADNCQRTRATVMLRSQGGCEACREENGCHLHYLYGGSGNRRKFEGPNATVLLCVRCHHEAHRADPIVLARLIEVAESIGAPDIVQAALNRRLEKVTP